MWIKGAKFRAGHSHVSLRSSLILSQIDELENRDKSCVIAGEKNLGILGKICWFPSAFYQLQIVLRLSEQDWP